MLVGLGFWFFEIFVCFIQSIVFVILLTSYLSERA